MTFWIVEHHDVLIVRFWANNVETASTLSLFSHCIPTLEDVVIALRQENADLKTKLDHSDKDGACLGYELSALKMNSLKVNDKASRLKIGMEDL